MSSKGQGNHWLKKRDEQAAILVRVVKARDTTREPCVTSDIAVTMSEKTGVEFTELRVKALIKHTQKPSGPFLPVVWHRADQRFVTADSRADVLAQYEKGVLGPVYKGVNRARYNALHIAVADFPQQAAAITENHILLTETMSVENRRIIAEAKAIAASKDETIVALLDRLGSLQRRMRGGK